MGDAWLGFVRWLHRRLRALAVRRPADLVIGGGHRPYLRRWWLIPRNPVLNVYLHYVLRSDDDRALHDHPWFNLSIILSGAYVEHTIRAGGINHRVRRRQGAVKFRSPWAAHRLELPVTVRDAGDGSLEKVPVPCWTLFITGPRMRAWGFHCADAGWRHHRDFTSGPNGETVGKGCD